MALNIPKFSEAKTTCDLCGLSTVDSFSNSLKYGEWMQHGTITVHYFCLLLSTHLPQRGKDSSGILGFIVRDIKEEIRAAKSRECASCDKPGASIRCCNCGVYFHMVCGQLNGCLFQFCGEFKSYCDECIPLTERQIELQENPPPFNSICHICKAVMGDYDAATWFYADCCGNGQVHMPCLRQYALAAGYYLKCIWCKNSGFREAVQLRGVFVPDRDALWEKQKYAFLDLHRSHQRCDVANCLCPRGREFSSNSGSWYLVLCSLCGSYGAHPKCIPGREQMKRKDVFKCETCANIEVALAEVRQKGNNRTNSTGPDVSLYITKTHNTSKSIDDNVSLDHDHAPTTPSNICNHDYAPTTPSNICKNDYAPTTPSNICKNDYAPTTPSNIHNLSKTTESVFNKSEAGQRSAHNQRIAVPETLSSKDQQPFRSRIPSSTPFNNDLNLTEVRVSVKARQLFNKDSPPRILTPSAASQQISERKLSPSDDDCPLALVEGTCKPNSTAADTSLAQSIIGDAVMIQSEEITSTSEDLSDKMQEFELLEFDEDYNCLGTVKIRLNPDSPRFAGRKITEEKILMSEGLITDADIMKRSSSTGIMAEINKFMDEFVGNHF